MLNLVKLTFFETPCILYGEEVSATVAKEATLFMSKFEN